MDWIILEICLFSVLGEIEIVEFISQLYLVLLFSSYHMELQFITSIESCMISSFMDLFSICRCRIKRSRMFKQILVKPYEFIFNIFLFCKL